MLIEICGKNNDGRALLSVKRAALSVTLNEAEVYTYDLEGRLMAAWLHDETYVRTLDNRMIKKWRVPTRLAPWKMIQELESDEARGFFERVSRRIEELLEKLQSGQWELVCERGANALSAQPVREWLVKIGGWDWWRLERERERFFSVYTPITILPPDQYLSLVLQATEGCHWNRCTFCHFYRHAAFHIKTEEEFSRHAKAVKEFFGAGILMRRSIFLGDANALAIPQKKLVRIFDRVNQEFPTGGGGSKPGVNGGRSFQGIYSFIDSFTGDKKSAADFLELKKRNLRRVYVGVETGADELLKFLNKPATSERTGETIETIKEAGLGVGVIILIGAGGDRYFRLHVEETIRILNELPLGGEDMIYFSPLVESPLSEYARRARDAGIRSLTDEERREQLKAIRSALRFSGEKKPKVALYDIREFVY